MENKRDYLHIEGEFNDANGIVSSISDLLTATDEAIALADNTISLAGYTCFEQASKMKELFHEIMDLYLEELKKTK